MYTFKDEFDKAAKIFHGKLRLRKALRCKRDELCSWYCGKEPIPVRYAMLLYEITNGAVRLSLLRTDIWNIELLRRILEEEGYSVHGMEENAQEA